VLGGALTDIGSWHWLFFINVPLGLVLLGLTPIYLTETVRQPGRFDVAGAVTSTLGMSALVYGLVACAAPDGWNETTTRVAFLAGLLLLLVFIWIEGKAEQPLMPLQLFASAKRSGAYLCRMLLVGSMLGMFFFLTQYVQNVLGFSAFETGLAFLALALTQFAMVMVVGPGLATLVGNTWLLAGGFLIAVIGMVCLSRVGVGTAYFPELFLALVILGIGAGATLVPLTTHGIAGVASHQSGAASGLVNAAHQLGGSMGTAVMVAVVGMYSQQPDVSVMTAATPVTIQASLAQALATAATVAIVFLALAMVITVTLMRDKRSPDGREQGADR
jgi:predicted MFS family arabinose efflux permease